MPFEYTRVCVCFILNLKNFASVDRVHCEIVFVNVFVMSKRALVSRSVFGEHVGLAVSRRVFVLVHRASTVQLSLSDTEFVRNVTKISNIDVPFTARNAISVRKSI